MLWDLECLRKGRYELLGFLWRHIILIQLLFDSLIVAVIILKLVFICHFQLLKVVPQLLHLDFILLLDLMVLNDLLYMDGCCTFAPFLEVVLDQSALDVTLILKGVEGLVVHLEEAR